MNEPAKLPFSVTRQAYDPRADFGRRTIHLSLSQISIERVMDGIKMKIAVPVAAYQALRIRVQAPHGTAVLTLSHDDPDLNIELASGDATEIAIAARAWSAVLDKALLVEAGVTMQAPQARNLKRPKPSRRSSFARRRKPGRPELMTMRFSREYEIIART